MLCIIYHTETAFHIKCVMTWWYLWAPGNLRIGYSKIVQTMIISNVRADKCQEVTRLMWNEVYLIKNDAGSFGRTSYWTLPICLHDYRIEAVGYTNIILWGKGISVCSYQYDCCIKYRWRRLYWLELSALWYHIPGEGNYKVVIIMIWVYLYTALWNLRADNF